MNKFANLDNKLARLTQAQGSEWKPYKYLKIDLKGFTTKAARGSSWIPTPEKYINAKCGLIDIKNEDDNECFKWCVKYHQSKKEKHCDRVSVLKRLRITMIIQVLILQQPFKIYKHLKIIIK